MSGQLREGHLPLLAGAHILERHRPLRQLVAADELARGTFAEIPDPFGEQNFPIYLGHRKTHWLTPAARLFCDLVREHLASDNEKAAASG